jgi:hypothetical protein
VPPNVTLIMCINQGLRSESRLLESLFFNRIVRYQNIAGTLVQLFRLRTSDVIAQSDPQRARKGW